MKRYFVIISVFVIIFTCVTMLVTTWWTTRVLNVSTTQDIKPYSKTESPILVTFEGIDEVLPDFDKLVQLKPASNQGKTHQTWLTSYDAKSRSNCATVKASSQIGSNSVDELVCEFRDIQDATREEVVDRISGLVFGYTLTRDLEQGSTVVSGDWSFRVVRSKDDYLLIVFSKS